MRPKALFSFRCAPLTAGFRKEFRPIINFAMRTAIPPADEIGLSALARVLARRLPYLVIVLAALAQAAEPVGPDAAIRPEDVVRIQLEALQHNDEPTKDAGIRQARMLAHPDNRRFTGPLTRFAQMIRSPAFRPPIGHAAHTIEPGVAAGPRVTFKVTIETADGAVFEYGWVVGQVTRGPDTGAWMTTGVSQPKRIGRAI